MGDDDQRLVGLLAQRTLTLTLTLILALALALALALTLTLTPSLPPGEPGVLSLLDEPALAARFPSPPRSGLGLERERGGRG